MWHLMLQVSLPVAHCPPLSLNCFQKGETLKTYEIPEKDARLFDVVGERHHIAEIAALGLNQHTTLEQGLVTETTFEIVPEPDNPYSTNGFALSVRKNNVVLGYLPDDGTNLQIVRAFHRIAASGLTAVTTGTLWTLQAKDGLKANIRVAIPERLKDSMLEDQGDAKLTPLAQTYEVPKAYQGEVVKTKAKGPSAKLEWLAVVLLFILFGSIPVAGPPIALIILIAGIVAIAGFKWRFEDLNRLFKK